MKTARWFKVSNLYLIKGRWEKRTISCYPRYDKPSAYRSDALMKKYKELGGEFKEDGERDLARWYKENWAADVGNKSYPVFRPTSLVNMEGRIADNYTQAYPWQNKIFCYFV